MSGSDPERGLEARQPAEPVPEREVLQQHPTALEVFGELTSIARRFRLRQLEKAIDQERAVVAAHRDLLTAKEAWRLAHDRLQPDNLKATLEAQRLKIRAERAEEQLRLAETLRKIETFEKRATIENIELEAEEYEAKLRLKQARDAYLGVTPEAPKEPEQDPEEALLQIVEALGALERERNELLQSTDATDAAVSAIDSKISAQLRRKAVIEEKLAGRP